MWQPKPAMWAPGIRQGHWLAQRLRRFFPIWNNDQLGPKDVLTGQLVGSASSKYAWSTGSLGLRVAGRYATGTAAPEFSMAPPITMFALVERTAASSWAGFLLYRSSNYSGSRTILHEDDAGHLASTWADDSGYAYDGPSIPLNEPALCVACITATRTTYYVASSGGIQSNAIVLNRSAHNRVYASLGNDGSSRILSGYMYAAGVIDGVLTAGEVEDLWIDPWGVLRQRQRTYFPVGASAGSEFTGSAWYYHLQQAVAA